MRVLFLCSLIILGLVSCNLLGPNGRRPSSQYQVTDEPVAFGQLKLKTIRRGLEDIATQSPMIKSVDRFEMDPVTRIINLQLTVNYPLESLFTFTNLPDENKSDIHQIEMAISLPKTKNLAYTRYLGLKFHKFKIDGDEHIGAFGVVLGAIKTLLANSNLIDYLYTKTESGLPSDDTRAILREILDNNGIVANYAANKINFKLNLAQFRSLSPYVEDYENLNLWRFSPTLFQGEEIRFKIIAGEGEPSKAWMESQQSRINDDTRTLLQVREDLYRDYSNTQNIQFIAKQYLEELLRNENIKLEKISTRFKRETQETLRTLISSAGNILSRDNENFIADPEFEYIEYVDHVKNTLRNFISDLDRRMSVEQNILAGGNSYSQDGPIVTKLVSQQLMNGTFNYLIDTSYENVHIIKEAQIWFRPELPGVTLKGKLNLPLEFMLGQADSSLANSQYESKITEIHGGIPFEMTLEKVVRDNGILGLDIRSASFLKGTQKITLNRNSKNQVFLFDMLKIYVSQVIEGLNIEFEDEVDAELKKKNEIREIKKYVNLLKQEYQSADPKDLFNFFKSDLANNPFILAGQEHIEKKKKIIFSDFISYNPKSNLFEGKIDASIVMDSINNVKTDLELWDLNPVYSKELDNTFLRLDVGKGKRSQKFIDEMYRLRGQAENTDFNGIFYELGKSRNAVDMLMTLDFTYLESYVNQFLQDMVKASDQDIVQKAKENTGETFYEVNHISLDITPKKEFWLNIKIKSAKQSKNLWTLWSPKLKEDSYSITAKVELSAKDVNLDKGQSSITSLKYFKEAIAINPKEVKVKMGKPTLINKAITGLLNSTTKLALNNGTMKKLLMKIANKFLMKMYKKENKDILGHEIEKMVRVFTTKNDLLIFLNPRMGGAEYDLHLTGKAHNKYEGIQLDSKNKKLHVAFTASVGMAKEDKKELTDILYQTSVLLDPILKLKSKSELSDAIIKGKLFDKLLNRSDDTSKALQKRYLDIMRKYDQVLHTTDFEGASRDMKQRISATGSELIYFAAVADNMGKKLSKMIKLMEKYGLKDTKHYYAAFAKARNQLNINITKPLIAQYKQRAHRINKTIINSKISYWTYIFYPDAYFSELVYQEIIR